MKEDTLELTVGVPVSCKVDVLVCGDGPAGLGAGIASARNGARTLLVEQLNTLGGMATSGLVSPFSQTVGWRNKTPYGGICKELFDRLQKNKGAEGRRFDVESFKYFAQIMCEESGVEFLLHSFVCHVITEKNYIKALVVANKAGLQAISAEVIIDATGDGDVAALAGAKYEKGDKDGKCQSTSMFFWAGGLDESKIPQRYEIGEKMKLARSRGEITLPDFVNSIDGFITTRKGEMGFNIDMNEGIDATDPKALTQAEIEGRKSVWECLRFVRKYFPGSENAYITRTPFLLGVRETRRILGEYILTGEEVLGARKFKEGIAKASHLIDLHGRVQHGLSESGKIRQSEQEWFRNYTADLTGRVYDYSPAPRPDAQETKDWTMSRLLPEGDWYEIPYRCLVPKDIDNLLTAGRCISSDRVANGSLRVMPTCMAIGQAAGTAAALAVKERIKPREIHGEKVREILISQGADL